MAQGAFAGATSYEDQTLEDILEDIKRWIVYSEETLSFFNEIITRLDEEKYYETIPFDLNALFQTTKRKLATFISDFHIILKSISTDKISKREVDLLKNIGKISIEENRKYKPIYHSALEHWSGEQYGNPNFQKIERLYAEGKDLFGTLMDASNAAERLKDYMSNERQQHQQITITGDGNQVQTALGNNNEFVMELTNSLGQAKAEELNRLLSDLKNNLDQYFKEDEQEKKEDAEHVIDGLRDEVTKSEPRKGIIRSYLNSLNGLSVSANLMTVVTGIKDIVESLPFMK